VPIAHRLIGDVRAQDATRPVVMGSDKYRSVPADLERLVSTGPPGCRRPRNGHEVRESAESYKAAYRTAFHGKALAMVTPTAPGALSIDVSGTGLRTGRVTVLALPTRVRRATRVAPGTRVVEIGGELQPRYGLTPTPFRP
jgi:hypothetical protein